MTYDEIRQNFINSGFQCTKHIWASTNREIMIDDVNELIAFRGYGQSNFSTMKYSGLRGYDVKEQGHSIMQNNMKNAIVGAVLFGATGAIVGASSKRKSVNMISNLTVYLMTDSITSPAIPINFIENPEQNDSVLYQNTFTRMKTFIGILDLILKQNEEAKNKEIET